MRRPAAGTDCAPYRGGGAPRYHLVTELYFDDRPALAAALNWPASETAARNVAGFAGKIIPLMIAGVEVA